LLEAPFTATITGPVLASGGTGTTILVSDHEAGVAVNPLKEMVLAPLSAPKLVPVTVIESPAIPEFVDKLVIKGVTTKVPVLLATVFTVTETFPTGRYQRLGERTSDGFGSGVYTTTLSLYTQSYFWTPNGRILRMRFNVSQAFSSTANVDGVSVYGTDGAFRGTATPGAAFAADVAWEYSLTRSWVLALEFNNRYQAATRVRGMELADSAGATAPARFDAPASDAFAIAPAVEYSWTPNLGVLLAMRVIPQGHHTTRSITPVIAINILR